MKSKCKRNEGGFTLIELIMVIVILGIISAVAIPKFLSLSDTARINAAQGIGGGISGSISSAHANYLLLATTASQYDLDDVLSATAFAGGVRYDDTVFASPASGIIIADAAGAAGDEIIINYKGKTFIWDYQALDTATGTPAYIEEQSGNFPTP